MTYSCVWCDETFETKDEAQGHDCEEKDGVDEVAILTGAGDDGS